MLTTTVEINTGASPTTVDVTDQAAEFCRTLGSGLLSVFVPHATAGIALVETGAGSDHDTLSAVEELLPATEGRWIHRHGSPGHGRDHVLPAFISPSVTVPVSEGRLLLGTWQSIVLVDTNSDNPRRTVRLSFVPG